MRAYKNRTVSIITAVQIRCNFWFIVKVNAILSQNFGCVAVKHMDWKAKCANCKEENVNKQNNHCIQFRVVLD